MTNRERQTMKLTAKISVISLALTLNVMVIAKDLRLVEDYEDEGLEIEMTTLPEPSEYSDDQDPLPVQYDDTWQSQPAQPDWNSWFSGPRYDQTGSRYDQGNSIDQSWDQDNWNWPWNQQTAPSGSFARPNLPISTMNTPSTTTNITTATTATTTTVPHEVTMASSFNNRCLTEPVGTHCDVCSDGYHGDKCQYSGKPSKTCK